MCEGFTGQLKFLFLTHRLTSAISLGVAQGDILISVTRDFQIDPASFTRMDPLVKLVEFVARLPARNVACIEMAIGVCDRVIALETMRGSLSRSKWPRFVKSNGHTKILRSRTW